jgi:hypothetical protein
VKYVITDKGEVAVGGGYHIQLARTLQGKVVAAGHCRLIGDGKRIEVFGRSAGFRIAAKPEDALVLARHLGL